jgi:succinate dehydrogenase flavin-adding protein (antitoxin of CptAB toxin-antitoxin module)
MSESGGVREVLFGLEEYLNYKHEENDVKFIREFVRILDSDDKEKAMLEYCLKKLNETNNYKDNLFRSIVDYKKKIGKDDVIADAMSRSQMKSKIWLINELCNIQPKYNNVLLLAGWYGQLFDLYDEKLGYDKARIVELDEESCEVSDYIFNAHVLQDYKVKSVCANINELTLHKNGYEWDVENFKEGTKYSEKFLPDLIINTSAEHMTEEWYNQIRFKNMESNPIVAIQSNNLFDIPEHINCVHSVDHMKKKFPMKEILFEGELQLKGYKRVMLIGRP